MRRAFFTKRSNSVLALTFEGLWSGSGGPEPGRPHDAEKLYRLALASLDKALAELPPALADAHGICARTMMFW